MREALLEAAIDHFGRQGFEGTATRAIARDSETAMSSITYHFGGKEGLYLAAADHIAARLREFYRPAVEQILARPPQTKTEAADTIIALMDHFATLLLAPQSEKLARFIIREQQNPTEAFDRLFDSAMQPIAEALARLLAIARPDLSDQEARASIVLMIGQPLALRAARASACRMLEVATLDREAADLLRRRMAAHLRCILAGDIAP